MSEAPTSKVFKSDLDRPSLIGVRQRYVGLQELIGQLSKKVSDVASNAENEFLSAYRVHMLSIQSELKDLNDQVTKAEEQLNDDGHVAKLEHEVSWFRDESSRLKTNTDSMNKDLEAMVQKHRALKEQKKFLSEQLKAVMKRSRVLESELQLNNNDHMSVGSNSTMSIRSPQVHVDISRRSPTEKFKPRKPTKIVGKVISDAKRVPKSKIIDNLLPSKAQPVPHQSYQEAVVQLTNSRCKAELALESSIKEIFRDIVLRKVAVTAQNSISRSDSQIPQHDVEHHLTQDSQISGPGGVTGLGLEHFTDIDRLETIIHFLSSPANFEMVVKAMFEQ